MKYATLSTALACCLLGACHSPAQEQAQQTAAAIQDAMKTYGPPQVATSSSGYTMTAVIGGKRWNAAGMMAFNASNDTYVNGSGGDIRMSFQIDKEHPALGKERRLGEGHAVDLTVGDRSWQAISGGYTLTRVDDKVVEGRMHFTAQAFQSSDTMEVTDGFFRVLPEAGK